MKFAQDLKTAFQSLFPCMSLQGNNIEKYEDEDETELENIPPIKEYIIIPPPPPLPPQFIMPSFPQFIKNNKLIYPNEDWTML